MKYLLLLLVCQAFAGQPENIVVVYQPNGPMYGPPSAPGGPVGPGGYGPGQVPNGPVGKQDPRWLEEQRRKQEEAIAQKIKAENELFERTHGPTVSPYGHVFKSPRPIREELIKTHNTFYTHMGPSTNAPSIAMVGATAIEMADEAYAQGDPYKDGEALKQIGTELADIFVGLDPVTGVGRGTYELVMGENLITGAPLSGYERGFAAFTVLSMGSGNYLRAAAKLAKTYHTFDEVQKVMKYAHKVFDARKAKGISTISQPLKSSDTLLKHNAGIFGHVPSELGEKLAGQTFATFDKFRESFWKAVGNSRYAEEFGSKNIKIMKDGLSPYAHTAEQLGSRKQYELHHIIPISEGGAVYDISNIMIATPRHHMKVLHGKL